MNYTEQNDIPGLLMIIDFEKAVDSLSWNFLHGVLDYFNFGPAIKRWIKIFTTDVHSSIIQCGNISKSFKLGRGCRQGDPVSSYCFVLSVEILSALIKNDKEIRGIRLY